MELTEEVISRLENLISNGKGGYVGSFSDEKDFNAFVITGPHPGTIDSFIGRVVQVRQEAGAYGSDTVFIRHINDVLMTHENQWFFYVHPDYIKEAEDLFKDTINDKPKETYTINGKNRRKGFIIPSKVKAGQSTPMRDIKNSLANKLSEFVGNQNTPETREEIKKEITKIL